MDEKTFTKIFSHKNVKIFKESFDESSLTSSTLLILHKNIFYVLYYPILINRIIYIYTLFIFHIICLNRDSLKDNKQMFVLWKNNKKKSIILYKIGLWEGIFLTLGMHYSFNG